MPFLQVNGITVPVRKNSWPGKPVFVGEHDVRAQSGTLEETFVRRVREWPNVQVVFQEPATAHAMRRILEGDFLAVSFDDSTYDFKGEGPAAGGAYAQSSIGGKHGGKVAVSSASFIEYATPAGWAPADGWMLMFWKKLTTADDGLGGAGTYYHHIAHGTGAITVAAAANPVGVTQYRDGVAGSFNIGNFINISSTGVRVYGKDGDASDNTKDYDELVFLPFVLPAAVTAAWAAQLYTWMNSWPFARAPFAKISGDCIPDTAPLEVRIKIADEKNVNVRLNGVHYNNALELELSVRER